MNAKKDGSLKEKNFKEYKVAHCKAEDAGNERVALDKTEKKSEPSVKATGDAVFPSQIPAKYAKEKEGTARRDACLEQYKANKETDKNGGLKWMQKGGGYYSECVAHLKNTATK